MFEEKQVIRRHVDLTPLINVIFLLLIFFMVVGSLSDGKSFDIDLPVASQDMKVLKNFYTIDIDSKDTFFFKGEAISKNDLSILIREAKFKNKGLRGVSLNADSRANADGVIYLIKLLQEFGIENIVLNTKIM